MTDCTFPRCGCSEREQCRPEDALKATEAEVTRLQGELEAAQAYAMDKRVEMSQLAARAEAAEKERDEWRQACLAHGEKAERAERQRDEAFTAGAEARALLSRCHEHLHNLTAIIPGNDLAYQKTTDLMAAIRALPIPAQEVK